MTLIRSICFRIAPMRPQVTIERFYRFLMLISHDCTYKCMIHPTFWILNIQDSDYYRHGTYQLLNIISNSLISFDHLSPLDVRKYSIHRSWICDSHSLHLKQRGTLRRARYMTNQ